MGAFDIQFSKTSKTVLGVTCQEGELTHKHINMITYGLNHPRGQLSEIRRESIKTFHFLQNIGLNLFPATLTSLVHTFLVISFTLISDHGLFLLMICQKSRSGSLPKNSETNLGLFMTL